MNTPPTVAPLPVTDVDEDEEIYHLLVHSVVDYAIFLLDSRGYIRTWNRGAERLKGYSREDIVGEHLSVFYAEEDRSDGFPEHELYVATREGRFEDEGWRIRKDGSRFWANVVITALFREGELVGFAKVTRDLTERKRAEDERERLLERERAARTQAEAANRAKSEFLAAMSHELRTPLNAIAGYLQLLEMGIAGELSPEQTEMLGRVRRNEEHLLALIDDLLQFTSIRAGQLRVSAAEVSVPEVLENLETLVPPDASGRFRYRCEACDPDLRAVGDRERIEQILLNLVSNAVKFGRPGTEVAVTAEPVGGAVHLRVRDAGPGIPDERLEEIFQPFVQARDAPSADFSRQGVGLGLAISRELAAAMGGTLTAESTPGAGSVFTLTLPRPG
jgi:PAS domain S-box-containing protein